MTHFWFALQPVLRSDDMKDSSVIVLPRRWMVEGTFARLTRCPLSKDYKVLPTSSDAVIYLAMIRLTFSRLAA